MAVVAAVFVAPILAQSTGTQAPIGPAAEPVPERIAPAFRAERHFSAGVAYLRALPDDTRIRIQRADGTAYTLTLAGGLLKTQLPAAELSKDARTLTLPLRYTIAADEDNPQAVRITAPSGRFTYFVKQKPYFLAVESDGRLWNTSSDEPSFRLNDGTRVDVLDQGATWEALTLNGERFRWHLEQGTWEKLAALPSPPLIPDMLLYYTAGDGDDWRQPFGEDHLVFAWNWYPHGLPLEQAILDVTNGWRRTELNKFYNDLDSVQPAADLGGTVLGRRLALHGGDRVTFERPGSKPDVVFLLPGGADPVSFQPTAQLPTSLGGVRQTKPKK